MALVQNQCIHNSRNSSDIFYWLKKTLKGKIRGSFRSKASHYKMFTLRLQCFVFISKNVWLHLIVTPSIGLENKQEIIVSNALLFSTCARSKNFYWNHAVNFCVVTSYSNRFPDHCVLSELQIVCIRKKIKGEGKISSHFIKEYSIQTWKTMRAKENCSAKAKTSNYLVITEWKTCISEGNSIL